jgi:hypothetical protein
MAIPRKLTGHHRRSLSLDQSRFRDTLCGIQAAAFNRIEGKARF